MDALWSRFSRLSMSALVVAVSAGLVLAAGPSKAARARARTEHWAFKPVRRPAEPGVKHTAWVRNSIDRFILARLEREGVTPSPEADRITLIRRLSLDLTGLPPTPAQVDAFVNDTRPDAYDRLIASLLASPHYGERWGRYWLDLARYADSDGYEKDSRRPWAWRYRDWVIDALNRDLPFDQFVIEQLAGDLLPDATLAQRIATGFHRNTLTNREGGVDQEEYRVKAVVDRVNTTSTVFLGLTVACSQCHAHKYDPIEQHEFYRLYAFFNNADEKDIGAPLPADKKAKARTLVERSTPRKTFLHERGDFLRPGDEVQAGTLQVLHSFTPRRETADRLDLAQWLVDPANPLTGRVAVNRIWQSLFGQGLVRTTEDFGTRGDPPSHPALLDWLTRAFIARGWSQKELITLIARSATYRQSSAIRARLHERDPENVLLARQNRYRVDAEIIRDVCLAASGLLNPKVGGPSMRPPLPPGVAAIGYANSVKWAESKGPDRYRRGLYIFFQRTVPYPMLMTFDCPDSNVTCARRARSNTPLQALTLLNDPVFLECARALGRRILIECPSRDPDARIRHAFRLCLGRTPHSDETRQLRELVDAQLRAFRANPDAAKKLADRYKPDGIDASEAAAWVTAARVMLNLDEFLTRE